MLSAAKNRDLSKCPADFQEAFGKLTEVTQKALRIAVKHEPEVRTMKEWVHLGKRGETAAEAGRAVREVTEEFTRAKQELVAVAWQNGVRYGQ